MWSTQNNLDSRILGADWMPKHVVKDLPLSSWNTNSVHQPRNPHAQLFSYWRRFMCLLFLFLGSWSHHKCQTKNEGRVLLWPLGNGTCGLCVYFPKLYLLLCVSFGCVLNIRIRAQISREDICRIAQWRTYIHPISSPFPQLVQQEIGQKSAWGVLFEDLLFNPSHKLHVNT